VFLFFFLVRSAITSILYSHQDPIREILIGNNLLFVLCICVTHGNKPSPMLPPILLRHYQPTIHPSHLSVIFAHYHLYILHWLIRMDLLAQVDLRSDISHGSKRGHQRTLCDPDAPQLPNLCVILL